MKYIGYFFIYGFALTAVIGLVASWIDRKVTARVQYRVGPPMLQPFIDLVKLLGKELVIPVGASQATFLLAPLVGLSSVMVVATLLWANVIAPSNSFLGDIIVAVYLLTIPSMSMIIGGFASRSPYASLGASREMKLVLGYELPFLLAIFVPVIKSGFSVRLGEIINAQLYSGAFAGDISGFLAFIVAMLCVQAKLGLVPFDVAEAETEIAGGVLVEYSGPALALFKLMKNMLLCVLPLFLILLFFGGVRLDGINIVYSILKYVGLVALITVIRNTNPRVRIDQAVRFFWGWITVIASVAVLLALKGF